MRAADVNLDAPPATDKQGKEKAPKHLAQQVTTDPLIGSPPALRFGDRQHGSSEKDDTGTNNRQARKNRPVNFIFAERCLILSKAKAPQPNHDVHDGGLTLTQCA
jgi:hypothetical protein